MNPRSKKEQISFSFSDLPEDYSYRYTLQFILNEKFGKQARAEMLKRLIEALGIKRRAFEHYLYVRYDSEYYVMSEDYLKIIAEVLHISTDLLITPAYKFRKAS